MNTMTADPFRNTNVCIHTQALLHNLRRVKQYIESGQPTETALQQSRPRLGPSILCMVKANAYGHGLKEVVTTLSHEPLCNGFGVAFFEEAIGLREYQKQAQLPLSQPVMIMQGAFNETEWQVGATLNAQFMIAQPQQLHWALTHVRPDDTVWLKLNSGMNRLGFSPAQAFKAGQQLLKAGYRVVLATHFANADEPLHPLNQQQMHTFHAVLNDFKQASSYGTQVLASCCNSPALIQWPQLHFDWVRPGIMLYGSSPFSHITAQTLGLQPVMTFSSSLMAIQPVEKGQAVGYGSRWTPADAGYIGIVAVGYGDGYPRVVDERAVVMLGGIKVPIVGRVSMDMLAIDLTDWQRTMQCLPDLGTPVTLWGTAPHVDDIAACAGTIGYELLCQVTQRPARLVAKGF